jgi:phage-related protein
MNLKVEFYQKEDGSYPVVDFLEGLPKKLSAKTVRTIKALEDMGTDLREPYSKPLWDGIFELRTKLGSDITRVLYFFVVGEKAVVTNGFLKKTDKTPVGELRLARKYRNEYMKKRGQV